MLTVLYKLTTDYLRIREERPTDKSAQGEIDLKYELLMMTPGKRLMSGEIVGQTRDWVLGEISGPRFITVDHGMEFHWRVLEDWASRRSLNGYRSVRVL